MPSISTNAASIRKRTKKKKKDKTRVPSDTDGISQDRSDFDGKMRSRQGRFQTPDGKYYLDSTYTFTNAEWGAANFQITTIEGNYFMPDPTFNRRYSHDKGKYTGLMILYKSSPSKATIARKKAREIRHKKRNDQKEHNKRHGKGKWRQYHKKRKSTHKARKPVPVKSNAGISTNAPPARHVSFAPSVKESDSDRDYTESDLPDNDSRDSKDSDQSDSSQSSDDSGYRTYHESNNKTRAYQFKSQEYPSQVGTVENWEYQPSHRYFRFHPAGANFAYKLGSRDRKLGKRAIFQTNYRYTSRDTITNLESRYDIEEELVRIHGWPKKAIKEERSEPLPASSYHSPDLAAASAGMMILAQRNAFANNYEEAYHHLYSMLVCIIGCHCAILERQHPTLVWRTLINYLESMTYRRLRDGEASYYGHFLDRLERTSRSNRLSIRSLAGPSLPITDEHSVTPAIAHATAAQPTMTLYTQARPTQPSFATRNQRRANRPQTQTYTGKPCCKNFYNQVPCFMAKPGQVKCFYDHLCPWCKTKHVRIKCPDSRSRNRELF